MNDPDKPFWKRLWEDELREFTIHWLGDLLKAVLVLLGLAVFFGFLKLLKRIGYDIADLHVLDKIHFWGAATAISILILAFIGKGIIGRK